MRRIASSLVFVSAILFVCFLAAAPTPRAQAPSKPNLTVVAPLVLYDDFNGPRIDPAKWENSAETSRMREAVRELFPSYQGQGNSRRLHLLAHSYSWAGNDQGVSWGWLGLQFPNPASITEISFNVLVASAAMSACQSNPEPTGATVGAQFRGRFFSTGVGAGDSGDVETVISLDRSDTDDTGAPLMVNGFYYAQDGSVSDVRTLGLVSLGQTAKLRIKWDQPKHQFIFQLNSDPAVLLRYYVSDTLPPNVQYKGIQVTPGTPNCTTTPPGSAMMDAYFDNVYVN